MNLKDVHLKILNLSLPSTPSFDSNDLDSLVALLPNVSPLPSTPSLDSNELDALVASLPSVSESESSPKPFDDFSSPPPFHHLLLKKFYDVKS